MIAIRLVKIYVLVHTPKKYKNLKKWTSEPLGPHNQSTDRLVNEERHCRRDFKASRDLAVLGRLFHCIFQSPYYVQSTWKTSLRTCWIHAWISDTNMCELRPLQRFCTKALQSSNVSKTKMLNFTQDCHSYKQKCTNPKYVLDNHMNTKLFTYKGPYSN